MLPGENAAVPGRRPAWLEFGEMVTVVAHRTGAKAGATEEQAPGAKVLAAV